MATLTDSVGHTQRCLLHVFPVSKECQLMLTALGYASSRLSCGGGGGRTIFSSSSKQDHKVGFGGCYMAESLAGIYLVNC